MSSPHNGNTQSLIPQDVLLMFGEPPLMAGEDRDGYDAILEKFAEFVKPADPIEFFWIKDLTDHSWEIIKLRRMKTLLIEVRRNEWHANQERSATLREEEAWKPVPVPDSEADSAALLMLLIPQYSAVDRLIASAELRRMRTLREIERRREDLAQRLHKVSDELIDKAVATTSSSATRN